MIGPVISTYHMATLSAIMTVVPSTTTAGRTVAFTTPQNYALRLADLITLRHHTPLWTPTLTVGPTPQTHSSLKSHLHPPALDPFSAVAFTSRAGISAFSDSASDVPNPLLSPLASADCFTVAALGKDSELLDPAFLSRISPDLSRIRTLVPNVASPRGIVESLGRGRGRMILCPVPAVVGIEEPPVVPEFIGDLEANDWVVVRVSAYETRWLGAKCAEAIVRRTESEGLDSIVFTSSGEVEGLLKSLKIGYGWEWEDLRRRWPEMVVAAHGPVTAAGAERLGVKVDVVSDKFGSFEGVVDTLCLRFESARTK